MNRHLYLNIMYRCRGSDRRNNLRVKCQWVIHWVDWREIIRQRSSYSPRHKHWPAGPAHFSDRRASSGQYILSFTGLDICQATIFQIVLARTMKNHRCTFPTSRQFSRSPFATRRQRVASWSRASQTHWRQCLDHAARDTSMRISGTHPGTFLREAHGMVPSKQFCVLVG